MDGSVRLFDCVYDVFVDWMELEMRLFILRNRATIIRALTCGIWICAMLVAALLALFCGWSLVAGAEYKLSEYKPTTYQIRSEADGDMVGLYKKIEAARAHEEKLYKLADEMQMEHPIKRGDK